MSALPLRGQDRDDFVIRIISRDHDHDTDDSADQTNVQHYHYEDKTGWGPARDRCLENNGDLVVVNSEEENM